jgi:Uma2 family endonuclease
MSTSACDQFLWPVDATPPEPVFRVSVSQYHEMSQAGILREEDRVELLDGWLVRKMVIKPAHATVTELVSDAIRDLLPTGWCVRSQQPLSLATSEPEPDVAIVCGNRLRYADRHPTAAEVALVVEVAEATLQRDRTTKQQIYAEAGIPVYWIVNLIEQRLEILSDPTGPSAAPQYRRRQDYLSADSVLVDIGGHSLGPMQVAGLMV